MATDITNTIERLEAFEERLNVRLESLSAFLEIEVYSSGDSRVLVCGELHPKDGSELQQDVELVTAVYDASGRVIGTDSRGYYTEDFFGLETFQIQVSIPIGDVARVRIYPKKRD